MNSFRDKLKEIRSLKEEEHRNRVPLTDDELGLNDGTVEYFLAREEVAHQIEVLMSEFVAETPRFAISRGFFEGKYSLSLSCDELCVDGRGEVDKCYSRMNFLLGTCNAGATLTIASKVTVLNKDLPKAGTSDTLTKEGGREALRAFCEAEMVRFAEEYFSARRPQPVPEASRN